MDNGIDFKNLNVNVDMDGLKSDLEKVEQNPDAAMEFPEVPDGQYEIQIEKLELTVSKKGLPMISGWFKIINGDYSGSMLFMNQVITFALGLYKSKKFLKDLMSKNDASISIDFENFEQYNNLILDIYEIVTENYEYIFDVSTNKKGFKDYEVIEAFNK